LSLQDRKKEARRAAAVAREYAHTELGAAAGAAFARFGLPDGAIGKTISGFLPYRSEIDLRPLLARLGGEGWTIALPVVVAKGEPLVFRAWTIGDPLIEGTWGIEIPPAAAPEVQPDLLLVPMLAFDSRGYRLGYGGGFYDRTLEKLRGLKPVAAIGVAYSAQEIQEVPRGPHDQPLDWIMTEKGHFKCA
jgi:5-formyltetrahydrofolate cyclo-ligase